MRLKDDQKKIFEDWIRRKIEHPTCHVCQANQWRVGDLLLPVVEDALEDVMRSDPRMVQLVCKNCAHVLLFDVRAIDGWIARTPSESWHGLM